MSKKKFVVGAFDDEPHWDASSNEGLSTWLASDKAAIARCREIGGLDNGNVEHGLLAVHLLRLAVNGEGEERQQESDAHCGFYALNSFGRVSNTELLGL